MAFPNPGRGWHESLMLAVRHCPLWRGTTGVCTSSCAGMRRDGWPEMRLASLGMPKICSGDYGWAGGESRNTPLLTRSKYPVSISLAGGESRNTPLNPLSRGDSARLWCGLSGCCNGEVFAQTACMIATGGFLGPDWRESFKQAGNHRPLWVDHRGV